MRLLVDAGDRLKRHRIDLDAPALVPPGRLSITGDVAGGKVVAARKKVPHHAYDASAGLERRSAESRRVWGVPSSGDLRPTMLSIVYVPSGRAVVVVDSRECELKQGDVLLSAQSLEWTLVDGIAWCLAVDRAADTAAWCDRLLRVAESEPTAKVGAPDRMRLATYLESLSAELDRRARDHEVVWALLSLISSTVTRTVAPVGGSQTRPVDRRAHEILDVVDRRFAGRLSLADVARELARSPASVARSARNGTGRTVLELIAERRVREAQRLLADTDMPVGAVADRVGFSSLGHFHRVFRRSAGTTPQRWRAAAPATRQ